MSESGIGVLEKPKTRTIGAANLDNRLDAAQVRREIHKSNICYLAIEMAKTGRQPVYDEESGGVIYENLSEAARIDMIKFLVKKVIPDIKEVESKDENPLDKWAKVIESDAVPIKG